MDDSAAFNLLYDAMGAWLVAVVANEAACGCSYDRLVGRGERRRKRTLGATAAAFPAALESPPPSGWTLPSVTPLYEPDVLTKPRDGQRLKPIRALQRMSSILQSMTKKTNKETTNKLTARPNRCQNPRVLLCGALEPLGT